MSRVLVTGSSGFIAGALIPHLERAGHQVTGLDRRPGARTDIHIDIRDVAAMQALTEKLRSRGESFDSVVHLAAVAGVRPSITNPHPYIETNVTGTITTLDLAVGLGATRAVVASSSSVYGDIARPAVEDGTRRRPLSNYAASKIGTEAVATTYAFSGALELVIVRPFTVYGPGQRPDMFCHRALLAVANGEPLQVWDWQRDFTYIEDLCVGAAAAVTVPMTEPRRDYNLGSGRPVSVHEFLDTLESVTGRSVNATFGERGIGEPRATHADTARSRTELGMPEPLPFLTGMMRQAESLGLIPEAATSAA